MSIKTDLITSIGKQLNIPYLGDGDSIARIVYSVAGQMALASLWDHDEDNETVSLQHFKKRIIQIINAYKDIFPEIKSIFSESTEDIAEEIYLIYLKNGFIYHSAYQVAPVIPAKSGLGNVVLHRGFSPEASLHMSGLGFYTIQDNMSDTAISDMFCLQTQSFESYLEELLENGEWENVDWPDNTEYLRLEPPFNKTYWNNEPIKDGKISLARYGEPNKIVVFYRSQDGVFQQKAIPEWRLRDFYPGDAESYGEYRRISAALLNRNGTLPEIRVHRIDDLISVKLGYRLPPSEEEFFKLYSWPELYNFTSQPSKVFSRYMSEKVFPVFKYELESIGYRFVEV